MSLPDVKVSPEPLNSTTRIARSSSARCNASTTAAYIATVRAFFFSGRLNSTSSTGPCCVTSTSLMGFSCLLSDQVMHPQRDRRDQIGHLLLDEGKIARPLEQRLVHVERAGDLDLQHMHVVRRFTVMLRYEAARIGGVAANQKAPAAQQGLCHARDPGRAGHSVQVAKDEFHRPRPGTLPGSGGRHGMAVDDQAVAKPCPDVRDQSKQRVVERTPVGENPPLGLCKGQLYRIDRLTRGDHLGDR